jgi:hypothetical protein
MRMLPGSAAEPKPSGLSGASTAFAFTAGVEVGADARPRMIEHALSRIFP